MTEHPTPTDTPIRAELYLRGDAHGGFGATEAVKRAMRLTANGSFSDSVVAGEWPRVHTLTDDWRSAAMDTYEAFRAWADQHGFSLEPGFQQRTRSFVGMDDVEEVVVFPVVALALYDEDRLRAVFPCSDESETYTVERALAAFERDDEDWLAQFDPVPAGHAEPNPGPTDVTAD